MDETFHEKDVGSAAAKHPVDSPEQEGAEAATSLRTYAAAGVHPVLFGLFPAVSLYFRNFGGLHPADLIAPVLIIAGSILAAEVIVFGLLRRPHRSGLILSAGVLLFFFGNRVVDIDSRLPLQSYNGVRTGLAVGFWLAVCFLAGVLILRLRRVDPRWTAAANRIALVLLFLPPVFGFEQWWGAIRTEDSLASKEAADPLLPPESSRKPADELPDIYFVVLDSYGRDDILSELYGHDNGPFLEALRQRGFAVASASHTNYPYTQLVLPSVLNFDYIQNLIDKPYRWDETLNTVAEARLFGMLDDLGYEILTYPDASFLYRELSLYSPYRDDFRNQLSAELLKMTPLRNLETMLGGKDYGTARIRRNLGALERVAARPGPTFVFLHIMAPHHPFYFHADGRDRERPIGILDVDWRENDYGGFRRYYAEDVAGLNTLLLEALDDLLRASPEPPVIVLFGDHGPRPQGFIHGWPWAFRQVMGEGRESAGGAADGETLLREWMSIFHAAYLPGHEDAFYSEITPVNSVRLILSRYLELEVPLLEDRIYFTPDSKPGGDDFDFYDVTDRLSAAEKPAVGPAAVSISETAE